MDQGEYVTVQQASEVSGISARTLHYWIQNGKLAHVIATKRKRGKLVSLPDVLALTETVATVETPLSANSAVAATLHDQDGIDQTQKNQAVVQRNLAGNALERIESLYRDQIEAERAAYAVALAAKDETITALRDQLAASPQRQEKQRRRWQFWRT